jgi:hypothetical protein
MHLLGLARLSCGDLAGAEAAWREGLDAPTERPCCALRGALAVLAGARGEGDARYALADGLAGRHRAACRALPYRLADVDEGVRAAIAAERGEAPGA